MASGPPVLIAGAGIAGLSCALALSLKGISSVILERRAELSEAGAGIQIGPNGMRVLQALGVDRALEPLAGKPQSIVVATSAGRILTELPLGSFMIKRYGAPYWVAHRADLQHVLARRVAEVGRDLIDLRTGQEVSGWREDDAGVTALLCDGREVSGRALVAADGIWSAVRRTMHPGCEPVFAGKIAARCVIPASRAEGRIAASKTGVWLGQDAHVVHYPVKGGAAIAVICIIDDDAERPRSWGTDIARDDVLARVSSFSAELRRFLSFGDGWQVWSLYDPPPLPSWSQGRVVLIGDAAHPILPFLAQGGVLALEDAIVLSGYFADCPADQPPDFAAFERSRVGRVQRVQSAARTNGRIYHMRGFSALARDGALSLVPASRLMGGLDWLYGWRFDYTPTQ